MFLRGPDRLQCLKESPIGTCAYHQGTISINAGDTVDPHSGGISISDPVYITKGLRTLTCCVIPTGVAASAGRLEYTLSPPDRVADDDATWWIWPKGDVVQPWVDVLVGPVTAMRAVCTAGSLTFEIVGA